MADDDKALMERLAALEAEVKADADEKEARKQAAMVKIREQQAAKQAQLDEDLESERAVARARTKKRAPDLDDVGGALELAAKANNVRSELTKAPKAGDKSWLKSTAASVLLGPVGWLYAGSMREAVPASAAYIAFAVLAAKIIPAMLLWPIMLVGLPLSGLAGLTYALQYNRTGKRQRLFGDKSAKQKQLP